MTSSRGNQKNLVFLLSLFCALLPFSAFGATRWYADGAVGASGDGQSWTTAKKTIQEGIDAAVSGDQIWVAEGVYSEHVAMKSGLSLYGGFSRNETSIEQRDLSRYRTVLDGAGRTETEMLLLDGVVVFEVDGIDVRNSPRIGIHAGGCFQDLGKFAGYLRNSRITGNHAEGLWTERSTISFENCYFGNNGGLAGLFAGLMYGSDIRNCTFENNTGDGLRAFAVAAIDRCTVVGNKLTGITTQGGTPIDRCVVVGNKLGGIYVYRSDGGPVRNCLIASNGEFGYKCTSYVFERPIPIINCTFTNNVSTSAQGGGIYCDTDWEEVMDPYPWFLGPCLRTMNGPYYFPIPTYLSVANCIFSKNSPAGIYFDYYSQVTVRNNLFSENSNDAQSDRASYPPGVFSQHRDYPTAADLNSSLKDAKDNLDGEPAFVNEVGGNFHLLRASAAIDRGTTVSLTGDFDGAPRPVDIPGVGVDGPNAFDIGAYEYQFVVPPQPPSLSDAADFGGGAVGLVWTDDNGTTPAQCLAFAYDVYAEEFAPRGWAGTLWYPFPSSARSGEIDVSQTGAYHAWISNQWWNGTWLPCLDPKTLIVYSGTPHTPTGLSVEDRGGGVWRLHWNPDNYGTWLDQIAVYQKDVGFIAPLGGPSQAFPQFSPWTFLDYGGQSYDSSKGDFFGGWADFLLPPGGPFTFFLNFKAWDGSTQGPFAYVATN